MGVDCTVPLNLKVMDRVLPIPEIEARIDEILANLANKESDA